MTVRYTTYLRMPIPDFRQSPWHAELEASLRQADAVVYRALVAGSTTTWLVDTLYSVGAKTIDPVDGTLWLNTTEHTSRASGLFSEDRDDNPSYWTSVGNSMVARGEWTNDTNYNVFDVAYDTDQGIVGLCQTGHTSSSAPNDITDDETNWAFLIDFRALASASAAAQIDYNNAVSLLTGDNVQDAIDELASEKADKISPALTGNPTVPTQTVGNNSTRIASTAFVATAVAALLDSAPGTLDTLNELADALGNDPDFATTVTTALGGKQPIDQNLTDLSDLAAVVNLEALADLTGAADKLLYFTGVGAMALISFGTGASQILQLTAAGKYPAIDGSLITGLTSGDTIPPGIMAPYGGVAVPSGWLECDASAKSRATYPNLFAALVKTATITVTIASPGVVTWTAHGLRTGDPVKFTTTGALPTGITGGTTYYVKNETTDSFQFSTTRGGSSVNTSGSQSGVQTGICAPHGDGDGSTTFNVPETRGEFIRGYARDRAVDTNRVIGSAQAQDIQPHTHDYLKMGGGATNLAAGSDTNSFTTDATTSTGTTETRPRNIAAMFIIKT